MFVCFVYRSSWKFYVETLGSEHLTQVLISVKSLFIRNILINQSLFGLVIYFYVRNNFISFQSRLIVLILCKYNLSISK